MKHALKTQHIAIAMNCFFYELVIYSKGITCLFLISIFTKNVGKSGQVLNPNPSLNMTLGKCLFNSLQLKGKDRFQVSGRAFLHTCSMNACKSTSQREVPKHQVLSLQQLLLSDSLNKKLYEISVCIKIALLILFTELSNDINKDFTILEI